MASEKAEEFAYTFLNGREKFVLRAPLTLPLQQSVAELSRLLVSAHNLPCYILSDMEFNLGQFVTNKMAKILDEAADRDIASVTSGQVRVDKLMSEWTSAFSQEVLKYSRREPMSNDLVFAEVYHSLIHSQCLEALLLLEHKYALAVEELLEKRDSNFANVASRQRQEMEDAVRQLGVGFTDDQINVLAQRHFEHVQMVESRWASELSSLQEGQRREYRGWVMRLHEELQAARTPLTQLYPMMGLPTDLSLGGERREDLEAYSPRREESFTVHLGAQLKTSHNIRLISVDVLDLCRQKRQASGGIAAQCLQTAISLYSNSLCGLVLLVDNRLNSYTGIKREFARVCQQSTDFHMPGLEAQLEAIEPLVGEAGVWRAHRRACVQGDALEGVGGGDRASVKSSGSSVSSDHVDPRGARLQTGDCYVTRHSNLSEVHAVFHLISDETVRSSVSEISSRHPLIMGYRSILKCCFRYDIRTITLPLLLVHEMSEEMTIPWCLKRAELMFKCIKGFIMELAMWSGQESCTIQFLVPKAISDETFASLSNMMPSIFRTSNPVIARS